MVTPAFLSKFGLYVADENTSRRYKSGRVMEWLEQPLPDQLFFKPAQENGGVGPIKLGSQNIFEQSRRGVDSRTYTRPKKRTFRPPLTEEGSSGGGTGTTNTTPSSNATFSSPASFGIIDIDNLTDSQLGFNMGGLEKWTPATLSLRNRTFERNSSFTPSTVSEKPQTQKYTLESPISPLETPNDIATTSERSQQLEQQPKKWKFSLGPEFDTPIHKPATSLIGQISAALRKSTEVMSKPNDDSKMFNASDLLSISFPKNILNSGGSVCTPPCVLSSSTPNQETVADTRNQTMTLNDNKSDNNDKTNTNNNVQQNVNVKTLSDDRICNGMDLVVEDIETDTPPSCDFLGKPMSFSTPTGTHGGKRPLDRSSLSMRTRKMNGISENGRLSDSSTEDAPSISTEDLSEEHNSGGTVLNHSMDGIEAAGKASSKPDINSEESPLSSTNRMSGSLKALNSTFDMMTTETPSNLSKKKRSGAGLNSVFRKSPLNTTFCKSAETLNGVERDSGPEEDGMSTASDSSFSSSSTHMRSVGEIQCIARLQEESLRQQCNSLNRTFCMAGDQGNDASTALQNDHHVRRNSTIRIPSSDDGNQSDQSDRSSDRYSPTTLNNNMRNATMRPSLKPPNSYRIGMGMQHAQSVELLSSCIPQLNGQGRVRMSGLRPPSVMSRIAQPVAPPPQPQLQPHQPPLQAPGVRPTGLRPPRAIPRPVSRLPAPKTRSALPKYAQRGGRPQ